MGEANKVCVRFWHVGHVDIGRDDFFSDGVTINFTYLSEVFIRIRGCQ